jgi:predicted PurR-regulated permease PerM
MTSQEIDARTVFAWVLLATLVVITWFLVRPLLSWLLATGFLVFPLVPVQRRLEERIDGRLAASVLVALVVFVVAGLLTIGVNVLVERGTALVDGIFTAEEFRQVHRTVERYTGYSVPIEPLFQQLVDRVTGYARQHVRSIVRTGLDAFVGFLLLTFVLYFLLVDRHSLVEWLRRTTPLAPPVRDDLFESTREMVWAVLKGHVAVAVVQGSVAGISLFLTGVPSPFLLTVAMMFLAIIPVIGVSPVLGGAVIFLFLEEEVLSAAFVVVWGFTAVAVTDDYLRAWLIGSETEIHKAIVFVGIAGGTYLLGVMGLFVGPILIGLLKVTIEVLGRHYGVTNGSLS